MCPPRLETGLVTIEVIGILFVLGFIIYGVFAYCQKSREVETLKYKLRIALEKKQDKHPLASVMNVPTEMSDSRSDILLR